MDYLCGTEVTLQWLLQRLSDKFGKNVEDEPQWITERLNRPNFNGNLEFFNINKLGWKKRTFFKN